MFHVISTHLAAERGKPGEKRRWHTHLFTGGLTHVSTGRHPLGRRVKEKHVSLAVRARGERRDEEEKMVHSEARPHL